MKTSKPINIEDVKIERFLSYIIVDKETNCWNFLKTTTGGYGYVVIKRRTFRAHRVSMAIFNGPLNPLLAIDHTCMNRKCVNPDHLREVSHRINAIENSNSMAAISSRKTHCVNGHEFSEDNIYRRGNQRHCKSCIKIRSTKHNTKKEI
jgi:hypothetical protein